MQCGSIENPAKLLKYILQKDLAQIRSSFREKKLVNTHLIFNDESRNGFQCIFTPLGVALIWGDEETLRVILEAGPLLYKQCEYRQLERGGLDRPAMVEYHSSPTVHRMEPALLLTRLLCHYRNVDNWHLLVPLCEAGLDPSHVSTVNIITPEEEGASMRCDVSTTVLNEVYVKISNETFDSLVSYGDISRSFLLLSNKIERLLDMVLCPVRLSETKFSSLIKHGIHDLNAQPTCIDSLFLTIRDRIARSEYGRETLYLQMFRRLQLLMLICEYRFSSEDDYRDQGAFSDDDDMWIGGEVYTLNFFARLQQIIHNWNRTPKRLTVLCRFNVRRHVRRRQFYQNVKSLHLPKFLEDFITLPDTTQWHKMEMRALDHDFLKGLSDIEL